MQHFKHDYNQKKNIRIHSEQQHFPQSTKRA